MGIERDEHDLKRPRTEAKIANNKQLMHGIDCQYHPQSVMFSTQGRSEKNSF